MSLRISIFNSIFSFSAVFFFCSISSNAANSSSSAKFPEIKPSFYSARIMKFMENWPPPTLSLSDNGKGEIIRAIKTPQDSDTIGMVKHFELAYAFEKVIQVLEDYPGNTNIWSDIQEVSVLGREGNVLWVRWTRSRPAFFLPKVQYEMLITIDRSTPKRVVYHNQLISGNLTDSSDSLVIIEDLVSNRTRISVLNFFTPAMGAFRALVESKIWKKSMRNGYEDDLALRLRLEHPDWNVEKIHDQAEEIADHFSWDTVEYTDALRFE
jgi:hypothetical protein